MAEELAGLDASIQQPHDQASSEERKEQLSEFYRPLHKATLNGDWESAESFLIQNPDADITQPLNQEGMNIVHIAANMGHAVFLKKLVGSRFFRKEALRLKDERDFTALHYAASVGSLSVVKILISQDNTLTQIPDDEGFVPLFYATRSYACKEVVWYLTHKTTNSDHPSGHAPFSGVKGANLICSLVNIGYYDICLHLFNLYPHLADDSVNNRRSHNMNDLLICLVSRPSSDFRSGSKLNFWERCIYHFIPVRTQLSVRSNSDLLEHSVLSTTIISNVAKGIRWIAGAAYIVPGLKHIGDEKYKHQCIMELLKVACEIMSNWKVNEIVPYFKKWNPHFKAIEKGATEFIIAFFEHFPHFMDTTNIAINILICSIENRQENVYNIMMEKGINVKFVSMYVHGECRENGLHLTAKLAPYTRLSSVSCPALQMQRELQWFKGVEIFCRPSLKVMMNKDGKTPQEVFTTEHKDLVRDGESWLKDTANSCLVVATLVITVVFAAAFTIPGGNIDGTGIPLFLRRSDFLVFAISDAIGMFSSATSILMFLSILTARYAEDDFLRALPKRLILGLVSLLVALASMMVTFGAALYIVLNPRFFWIIFPIIGITSIPVGLFIMLQLPSIIFMLRSTYGPSILKDKIKSNK